MRRNSDEEAQGYKSDEDESERDGVAADGKAKKPKKHHRHSHHPPRHPPQPQQDSGEDGSEADKSDDVDDSSEKQRKDDGRRAPEGGSLGFDFQGLDDIDLSFFEKPKQAKRDDPQEPTKPSKQQVRETLLDLLGGGGGGGDDDVSALARSLPPAAEPKQRAAAEEEPAAKGRDMFEDALAEVMERKKQRSQAPAEGEHDRRTQRATEEKKKRDDDDAHKDFGAKAPAAGVRAKQRREGQLLSEWAAKENVNLAGLRRAKKSPSWGKKGTKGRDAQKAMMEDVHTVEIPFFDHPDEALVMVADGHAGRGAADEACKVLPQIFASELAKWRTDHSPSDSTAGEGLKEALVAAFLAADERLTQFEFEGCTATVAFLWQQDGRRFLQVANVGDSAAFVQRGDATAKLTYDHKVTDPAEKKRLISEGVEITEKATRINGLAVSRALGDHFMKQEKQGVSAIPFVSELIELTDADTTLIVASDGLWDVMSGQQAMREIRHLSTAEEAASSLIRTALQSSACKDNITVIVVYL